MAVKKLLQIKGRGFGVEGILDPFASGLLIAATGVSTRFLSYFLALPKTYTATITLGSETDTLDTQGAVVLRKPVPALSAALLTEIAAKFTGAIEQVPPLYSNVKIDGQRAHKIARQGESVELRPRRVSIHALSLAMEFHSQAVDFHTVAMEKQSQIMMRCTVSSGTYIRSLARDIARALGTCGYLSMLRRISIGDFSVGENPPADASGFITSQMPDSEALSFFDMIPVSEDEARKFLNGVAVRPAAKTDGIYRVRCGERFCGLGRLKGGELRVEKIYSTAPIPPD